MPSVMKVNTLFIALSVLLVSGISSCKKDTVADLPIDDASGHDIASKAGGHQRTTVLAGLLKMRGEHRKTVWSTAIIRRPI